MTPTGIVIIGSTGMLGRELVAACRRRGPEARAFVGPDEIDITDEPAVRLLMARERPAVVINATGYTDVDAAEAVVTLVPQHDGVTIFLTGRGSLDELDDLEGRVPALIALLLLHRALPFLVAMGPRSTPAA